MRPGCNIFKAYILPVIFGDEFKCGHKTNKGFISLKYPRIKGIENFSEDQLDK